MTDVQPWCVIREEAKERSPSPTRRMVSVGEKGRVGCVWVRDLLFDLFVEFDFEVAEPLVVFCDWGFDFEIPDGRVSFVGFCFLDWLPASFEPLFLPIVRLGVWELAYREGMLLLM